MNEVHTTRKASIILITLSILLPVQVVIILIGSFLAALGAHSKADSMIATTVGLISLGVTLFGTPTVLILSIIWRAKARKNNEPTVGFWISIGLTGLSILIVIFAVLSYLFSSLLVINSQVN